MDSFWRSIVLIVSIVLLATPSPSQAGKPEATNDRAEWKLTEQRGENPIQDSSRWKDIVGHRVAVEGLLWGSGKGLDPYVALHGVWFTLKEANFYEGMTMGSLSGSLAH